MYKCHNIDIWFDKNCKFFSIHKLRISVADIEKQELFVGATEAHLCTFLICVCGLFLQFFFSRSGATFLYKSLKKCILSCAFLHFGTALAPYAMARFRATICRLTTLQFQVPKGCAVKDEESSRCGREQASKHLQTLELAQLLVQNTAR